MREQYQRAASGVSVRRCPATRARSPPAAMPALKYSMKYSTSPRLPSSAPNSMRVDARAARVADRLALHFDVGFAIKLQRKVEPLAFVAAFESEQRLADFVFQVQDRCRS